MPISTVTVSVQAWLITGGPLPQGRVFFELTGMDVNAGIVAPKATHITLDTSGSGSVELWSNNSGTQGTRYRVSLTDSRGNFQFAGYATIPQTDCNLHDVLNLQAPDVVDDAEAAALAAQGYAAQASSAATTAAQAAIATHVAQSDPHTQYITQAELDAALAGSAVQSVNGRTGAVTIISQDVTDALGFTPANAASVPTTTDALAEGATNQYFTAARVRAAVLTGLSTATNAVITAGDSVLSAFGKLQAQASALATSVTSLLGLNSRTVLQADTTYHIATTGSDSNDGSSGSPWLTPQHAVDWVAAHIDGGGHVIEFLFADGEYGGFTLNGMAPAARYWFRGNSTDKTAVVINDSVLGWACVDIETPVGYGTFQDMTFKVTAASNTAVAVDANNCYIEFRDVYWKNTSGSAALDVLGLYNDNATVSIGSSLFAGGAGGTCAIEGDWDNFIGGWAPHTYALMANGSTINLVDTPAFGNAFVLLNESYCSCISLATYTGAAEGRRFYVRDSSLRGVASLTGLPGSVAGEIVGTGTYGQSLTEHDLTEKVTPVDNDYVQLTDSAASNARKFFKWSSLKAAMRTYLLAIVNVFTKNQSVTPSALVSGASIAVDASLSNNFPLTLGTNATLANPTNLTNGMVLNFRIKQDATGGRTLAYGTKYKFPGGSAPVLSTAANAVDLMSCYYDSTDDTLCCVMQKGFA